MIQDVRFGLRTMRRNPAFAATAICTLALGIGATTSIFSVVHALMLRPLPFVEPDRLVVLFATTPARGVDRDTTSFLDFTAWRDQTQGLVDAAAYRQEGFNITGDGPPEPVTGLRASHELLGVLGVAPITGRPFTAGEQRGADAVVLISHGLWTHRYAQDSGILQRAILINEVRHAVIGVLPPGFQFPAFEATDVIVPVPERPCRSCGYVRVVARLKPAVPIATAQQELDAIAARLATAFPDSNEGRGVSVVPLQDVVAGAIRTPLLLLFGAAVFVLLIGCGNVGHLVLARGIARQRELTLRSALGAGRGRLVRQLLTESTTLAVVAAGLGTILAVWGSGFLTSSLSQQFRLPLVAFNWIPIGFALVLAVLSGLVSGLPPALMTWKSSLSGVLATSRTQSGGRAERRLAQVLIVGETALTVMLLLGAGLLVKSFVRLQQIELGADTHRALTAELLLPRQYVEAGRRESYLAQLMEAVGTLPGVRRVALHVDPPFVGAGRRETFRIEGHDDPQPGRGHPAAFNIVYGAFFQAMDMPLVRGRGFGDDDTATSPPVAVINEAMARTFWPREEALGKRLQFYYDKNRARWLTIVGVARDVRYHGRLTDPSPHVFVPGRQPFYKPQDAFTALVVRTDGDPGALLGAVRARIWEVEPHQPISRLQTLDRALWESAAAPRVYMRLLGAFALVALMIAGAGIYGVGAYAVARRTREIGIRLAIGATPGQVLRLVARQGLLLILAGTGLGVAGTLALHRVLARFLYGTTAADPATFTAVLALFAAVATCSTFIPARRAARVDPMVSFRAE